MVNNKCYHTSKKLVTQQDKNNLLPVFTSKPYWCQEGDVRVKEFITCITSALYNLQMRYYNESTNLEVVGLIKQQNKRYREINNLWYFQQYLIFVFIQHLYTEEPIESILDNRLIDCYINYYNCFGIDLTCLLECLKTKTCKRC